MGSEDAAEEGRRRGGREGEGRARGEAGREEEVETDGAVGLGREEAGWRRRLQGDAEEVDGITGTRVQILIRPRLDCQFERAC